MGNCPGGNCSAWWRGFLIGNCPDGSYPGEELSRQVPIVALTENE